MQKFTAQELLEYALKNGKSISLKNGAVAKIMGYISLTDEYIGYVVGVSSITLKQKVKATTWTKEGVNTELSDYNIKVISSTNELAEYAGERYKETLLNLHNMIDDGMLPYARFDDEFKTLILTDRMYSRYSYIKRYRNSSNVSVDVKDEKLQSQMAVAIREDGEAFLKDVDICKNLAGDEFDIKTECFNRIIEKIFNYLDEVPSSANELYVLMNSYIKAIRKLLFAYTNLEKDDASNTWSIKLEISEAIDEINDVFETNIDKLYK